MRMISGAARQYLQSSRERMLCVLDPKTVASASQQLDHLRDPMSADVKWLQPFKKGNAGTLCAVRNNSLERSKSITYSFQTPPRLFPRASVRRPTNIAP